MPFYRMFIFLFALLFSSVVLAEGIKLKSAELSPGDDAFNLRANFGINLNPTLEEALKRGVSLSFTTEFELTRKRWYWMDETIFETSWNTKLSYNALTRQYHLSYGALYQHFDNLNDALQLLGSVRNRQTINKTAVKKGNGYIARIRMSLDLSKLPKPFQINALASNEWDLGSDWFGWDFMP